MSIPAFTNFILAKKALIFAVAFMGLPPNSIPMPQAITYGDLHIIQRNERGAFHPQQDWIEIDTTVKDACAEGVFLVHEMAHHAKWYMGQPQNEIEPVAAQFAWSDAQCL